MKSHLVIALVLASCAPQPIARPAPTPAPLAPRDFKLPATRTLTLSNGLKIVVAENHEVPLWDLRVLFDVGSFADPDGKEGLAGATLDVMNDGAGDLSAEDLSRALKRLGSSISGFADDDGAQIAATGMTANVGTTLDLLAKVILEPTFPASEWDVSRTQRIANLKANRENPTAIASRVLPGMLFDGAYRGRLTTEAAYTAITVDDMKAFRAKYLGPDHAIVIAGGDLDPDALREMLEARFGAWKATGNPIAPEPKAHARTNTLYLIDKPGAAQSVIKVFTGAPTRTDADYYGMVVANLAFGGAFTSRLNLNLREDKGYTYGARCGTINGHGPSFWICSTSVATDVTGPSLVEIKKELTGALGDKPFTADEVGNVATGEILGFPGQFELTGAILGEQANIWRYHLPADQTERYVPGVRAVTPESATSAFRAHVQVDQLTWLVVGDASKIRDSLQTLGLPVVELDRDGRPVGGP